MGDVWYRGPNRLDLLTAAVLTSCASWDRPDLALQAVGAVEPGAVTTYNPGSPWTQRVYVVTTANYVVVVIPGTETWQQFVGNVLGSLQAHQSPIPGQVAVYWGQLGQQVYGLIRPQLVADLPGRRLVFAGHSLGAAVAQVVAALVTQELGADFRAHLFGCPRVGNPAFAQSFGPSQVWRIVTQDDPVADVPPPLWGGLVLPLPWPGPLSPVVYQHAGNGYGLLGDGSLTVQAGGLPIGSVASLLVYGDASTRHSIDTYAGRLRSQLAAGNLIAGAAGYVAPADLDRVLLALQGLAGVGMGLPAAPPAPISPPQQTDTGGGVMANWRATFMFKAGSYGWTESFYTVAEDHGTVLGKAEGLAKLRIGMCGYGVEMPAVRISDVARFRDYGLSPLGFNTGAESTDDASHVKPYCALLTQLSSGAFRNRVFLRGVPSLDYLGDSPLNVQPALEKAKNAWANKLKVDNWTIKVQDRYNALISGNVAGADLSSPVVVTLDKPDILTTGDQIYIRGVLGQTSINGTHYVEKVTATTYKVRNTVSIAPYTGRGTWRKVAFTYPLIDSVKFLREVSHRTGRPFDAPVGRRRRR